VAGLNPLQRLSTRSKHMPREAVGQVRRPAQHPTGLDRVAQKRLLDGKLRAVRLNRSGLCVVYPGSSFSDPNGRTPEPARPANDAESAVVQRQAE
jgi:hypothetical protein